MAVAAGVAMVPPMAWHSTPHGAMESCATPWNAVGMPWYAMGGTMGMPRQNQIVENPVKRADPIVFAQVTKNDH